MLTAIKIALKNLRAHKRVFIKIFVYFFSISIILSVGTTCVLTLRNTLSDFLEQYRAFNFFKIKNLDKQLEKELSKENCEIYSFDFIPVTVSNFLLESRTPPNGSSYTLAIGISENAEELIPPVVQQYYNNSSDNGFISSGRLPEKSNEIFLPGQNLINTAYPKPKDYIGKQISFNADIGVGERNYTYTVVGVGANITNDALLDYKFWFVDVNDALAMGGASTSSNTKIYPQSFSDYENVRGIIEKHLGEKNYSYLGGNYANKAILIEGITKLLSGLLLCVGIPFVLVFILLIGLALFNLLNGLKGYYSILLFCGCSSKKILAIQIIQLFVCAVVSFIIATTLGMIMLPIISNVVLQFRINISLSMVVLFLSGLSVFVAIFIIASLLCVVTGRLVNQNFKNSS